MPRFRLNTEVPSTPAEYLAVRVRDYLHMPDPGALYTLLGSVAANLIEGPPVWLMLVGPPGCGKTELLNALIDLPGMYELASISGESAFLSATPKKERAADATGGILKQVGDHGGVVINDFTSVLELGRERLEEVLSVFRETYSGRWRRNVGVEGGRVIEWTGHVAFFGGVTGDIDRRQQVSAALGERWMYYRMREGTEQPGSNYEAARQALMNSSRNGWRTDLRGLVSGFFSGLDLEFGKRARRRQLTDAEMVRIIRIGSVAATCRSAVVRDSYTRDIVSVRETECESRIAASLGQLLLGLEIIGVGEKQRWKLIGKVALDSMPQVRRVVVEQARARAADGGVSIAELKRITGCSDSTVRRAVEDLEVHGVLEQTTVDANGRKKTNLTKWMQGEWKKGWRGI